MRSNGMVEARNFKFGMHIDHEGHYQTKCKIRSKGVGKGSSDLFLKFWDPWETVKARDFKFRMHVDHEGH